MANGADLVSRLELLYSIVANTTFGTGDMLTTNNLSDVGDALTSFNNIKQNATDTLTGVVELAIQSEVNAGTDTTRVVTPDTLEDKTYGTFTGITIGDNVTLKTALQQLETALETGSTVSSSVATIDATPTEIDKIDTLTDNSTHLIEVKLTAKSDDDLEYGIWSFNLNVTKFNGTPIVRVADSVTHDSSAGLSVGSVTFTVNTGDIDIDVTGIVATNIQWDCQYEIILTSTN